ncbi:40S ribosomal protein S8 [Perkinsela sp. CCAP 1560/4]|nr:40S ribosomal protein S8 [Perkinsela sp. CCAP 1560/4]|eukprot:KNH09283.1 40S ribosomal protein S8 [Perkinsela sp. CCAP 1560/4]
MKQSERIALKNTLRAPFFWIAGDKLVLSRKNCETYGIKLPSIDQGAIPDSIIFSETNPYIHKGLCIGKSAVHGRGIFSVEEIPPGREIMRIPALVSHGGEDTHSECILKCVYSLLDTLNRACGARKVMEDTSATLWENIFRYMEGNVLALLGRNWKPLSSKSVETITDKKCQSLFYLSTQHGKYFAPNEIASVFEFNRFDVKRQKKNYCGVFPEASLFNHDCSPNVEIEIITPSSFGIASAASSSSTCILIARTCRKVISSEELFISYNKSEGLPLTENAERLRRRWRFQCACRACRYRLMRASLLIFFVLGSINYYFLRKYVKKMHE